MDTIPFEAFLEKFSRLKAKVNNNPANLHWKSKNDPSLGKLAFELYGDFQGIVRGLAALPMKSVTPPTAIFTDTFREFGEKWKVPVQSIGDEWIAQQLPEVMRFIEGIDPEKLQENHPELAESLLDPPKFNPTAENPYEESEYIFWWADISMSNHKGTDIGDSLHKALQAWDHYQNTIGLNLRAIWHRWSKVQTVLVPPHVAGSPIRDGRAGLVELLSEAVKAFVFGVNGAAIAMCRALTEMILIEYYGVGEGKLDNIIVLAEKKYRWIQSLKLQETRMLANRVLHCREKTSEEAILGYLATIKELIERAPARTT